MKIHPLKVAVVALGTACSAQQNTLTRIPSRTPTIKSSYAPTYEPTYEPTKKPITSSPSYLPTSSPSNEPSSYPSSYKPSYAYEPTQLPTESLTRTANMKSDNSSNVDRDKSSSHSAGIGTLAPAIGLFLPIIVCLGYFLYNRNNQHERNKPQNIENNNNDVVEQVHKSEPTPFLNKNNLNQASYDLEYVQKILTNL
ncbi:MAG: hypothetical protein CL503_01425 [Actinobacteria bacterium]|nr:hypothetical protein [Actinomycetota bacterium]